MTLRNDSERASETSRSNKSPAHLLLLPVAFAVDGACCYVLMLAAIEVAGSLRGDAKFFSSYGEITKCVIALSMFLASIPIGLLAANAAAWIVPPVRRYFDREAEDRGGNGFRPAMLGLLRFAMYWTPGLSAIGFGAAFFGR